MPPTPDSKLETFHLWTEPAGRPRPQDRRAPAGTAVVIALAWAVGFVLGALVAAVAGWL